MQNTTTKSATVVWQIASVDSARNSSNEKRKDKTKNQKVGKVGNEIDGGEKNAGNNRIGRGINGRKNVVKSRNYQK